MSDKLDMAYINSLPQEAQPVDDVTYQYACSLAQSIFNSEYASDEPYASGKVKWGLCDTTAGVLTQIDNMVRGMKRAPQPARAGAVELSDTVLLDWLETKTVNVRTTPRYGSHNLFWAGPSADDGLPVKSDLRERIAKEIAAATTAARAGRKNHEPCLQLCI